MHRTEQAALAAAVGLTIAAFPAQADHSSMHVTVVGNLAGTDNAFSASDEGNREADVFVQVRPGVLLAYETPRMVQALSAEVEVLGFVRNNDSSTVNFHGGYLGRLEATPRSAFNFVANALSGQLSQLGSRTTPDQTGVTVVPPGNVDIRQADGSEVYSYQVSPDSRFLQSVSGVASSSDDHIALSTTTLQGGFALGGDHSWRGDAVGAEVGLSVLRLERLGPDTGGQNGIDRLDRQINPRVSASWRHDLNRELSTSLSGGLVMINPFGKDPFNPLDMSRTREYLPVINGSVAYITSGGSATITAGRAVAPNQFIAENTLSDSVVLQGAMPLYFPGNRRLAPRYFAAASLGYAHTKLIDDASSAAIGAFDVAHGDLGVSWSPRPGMAYGVRYEYFRQFGSDNGTAAGMFGSFSRSTVFVTFAARWPETVTVAEPRKSQSQRADGSDSAPVGEEQVVPDDGAPTTDKRGQGGGGNQGGTGGTSGNSSGTSGTGPSGVSGGNLGGVSGGGGN